MSMFCQIMDKSESNGCGCKTPSSELTKTLSQTAAANMVTQLGYSDRIAGATVRISIDEEQCQFAYERILEGIAQALKLSSPVSAVHAGAHAL